MLVLQFLNNVFKMEEISLKRQSMLVNSFNSVYDVLVLCTKIKYSEDVSCPENQHLKSRFLSVFDPQSVAPVACVSLYIIVYQCLNICSKRI